MALRKIAQRRMLEIVDLTSQELREVEEAEEQVVLAPLEPQEQGDMMAGIQNKLGELQSLNAA